MRRMYSEQELSVIVYQVMGQYIENGAFNQTINDYIDAYLVEHPIDPTAITGLDIAPKNVTASGNITAPSIIENMSGYSFNKNSSITYSYANVIKNGNKVTFAISGELTKGTENSTIALGTFTIPESIANKIIPYNEYGDVCYVIVPIVGAGYVLYNNPTLIKKNTSTTISATLRFDNSIANETPYKFRFEVTFLLANSLA